MNRAYRKDPAWLQAQADYVSDWPELDPSARLIRRTVAAMRMRNIEVAIQETVRQQLALIEGVS